jgi:hypothetical protein
VRTPCAKCGTILHTGEGRVTVSFTVDELIALAFAETSSALADRLLCAASLLDEAAVRRARMEHYGEQAR